jgi:hypothetical protein
MQITDLKHCLISLKKCLIKQKELFTMYNNSVLSMSLINIAILHKDKKEKTKF